MTTTPQDASLIAEMAFRLAEKGMNLEAVLITIAEGYKPFWRSRYTEEEQGIILDLKTEEIRDCAREVAEENLDESTDTLELDAMIIDEFDFKLILDLSEGQRGTPINAQTIDRAIELGLFNRDAGQLTISITPYGVNYRERNL